MGFSDWFKKAKDTAVDQKDTVKDGIDKAAGMADKKTGGQHSEQIDTGADKAKEVVDGLGDE